MKSNERLTLEEVASILGIPSLRPVEEDFGSCYHEGYLYSRTEALDGRDENSLTDFELAKIESEAEAFGLQAEASAMDEAFSDWKNNLLSVAEKYFGEHGMRLVARKRAHDFVIRPINNWNEVLEKIRNTIKFGD